jgi:4a-hydroxytetrahydrobiopterin dehydratase
MAPLTDAQIEERLAKAGEWQRGAGSSIVRDLQFSDFAAAIAFVDRVAEVAEAANHHPDILLHGWNNVRLTLSTHSQGGLTDADFELAGQIDRLG